MFIKILLVLLVLLAIYWFFFKSKIFRDKTKDNKKDDKIISSEPMVECPKCGTFVSNKEAIIKDGKFFCSRECAGI